MDGQSNSSAPSGDAAADRGGSPSLARAAKKRRRSDESSTSGNDTTNSDVDDNQVTTLPPEMWANVMNYLPFDTILSCCVVSRSMLHETMPLLTKIQIDKAGQMNLAVASRFRDVTDIHINSLILRQVFNEGTYDEHANVSFDFESRIRVLPFLFCFVKTLERVHFGAKDNLGKVIEGFSIVDEWFYPDDMGEGYPHESSWDILMAFIDSLSGAFFCGAFPKHLQISGLCCPASGDGFGHRNRDCTTCKRACKSFPLESVAAFHSQGSSRGYAHAGRAFGLDVCLPMTEIDSIVESRPGGKELLLSDERLFRLLASGRRCEIGDSDVGKLVIVKYDKYLLDKMKKVIAHTGLDAKKLSTEKLHEAIAMSFQKGTSPVHKTQRYLPEESLHRLKDKIDLCIDAAEICGSTLELLPCAKSVVHVLVQSYDEESIHWRWRYFDRDSTYEGILEDCFSLLRRFLELEKDTPIKDYMNNVIPCLAKASDASSEHRMEAASILRMIYSRGSEEQRKMIIDAEVISKFVRLLDTSKEGLSKVALSGLVDILADKKKEHIDELVRAKGVPKLIEMILSEDVLIAKDSLSLLVTVGNDHIQELIDTKAHEDLFRIIASEAHAESLSQCSILLRKMSEVKPLALSTSSAIAHQRFQRACISNLQKLVEVLSRTEDEVVQTNLAFVCITHASEANEDNIESLMSDTGLLPMLVDLQDSPLGDVADSAITCLERISKMKSVFATKSGETLAWGEYRMLELVDSEEDESLVSCEEALEVSDEEVALEVQQAEVDKYSATSNKEKDSLILSLYQKMQKSCDNEIMEIVCDQTEVDGVSVLHLDSLHSLAANILTRMNRDGPVVSFRLRGDTADYLFELLQGYMIKRLENALLMAMHDHRTEVQKEDFILLPSQEMQSKCNVGNKYHGISLVRSCSLPSYSGIVWRWPENDCRDVLQPGAGRRIIRRLAYKAGIVEMTSDLLELAQAELLHTLGILLVEAYESSVDMAESVRYLDPKQTLTYGSCAGPMDMFYTPPPPFNASPSHEHSNEDDRKQPVYTIVPGQISVAAEKRGIGPSKVYSHYFSVSSPSADEEMMAEKEYYYEDGYFEDCEPKPGTCDCSCMFECNCNVMDIIDDPREASEEHSGGEAAAVEVEDGVDVKSKDIDLIMRVTGYSRVNAMKALKENDNDKRKVFNEYVARQLDAATGANLLHR